MRPRLLFAALSTVLFLSGIRAAEKEYPPVNPALLYWQAAAMLPTLTDEQATELRDMAAGKLPVDPAKATVLGSDASIHLIRKAALSSAPCDWGLAREDGPAMALPHLSKMRQLTSLALVESERQFLKGDSTSGIDWLLVAHRMARHSGAGDTLISFLVQESGEESALRAAARHCLGWDENTRRQYAEKLNSLPLPHSLQDSYRGEKVFIDWLGNLSARGDETKRKLLTESLGSVNNEKESDQGKALHNLISDPEAWRKEMTALYDFHSRTVAAFGKPWKEASTELEAINADIQSGDVILAKLSFPAVTSIHDRAFVTATLRTMLVAALDHGTQLDDTIVATYHDAFDDNPLRLLKAEDGTLSLCSAGPHPKDKVIQLSLGK